MMKKLFGKKSSSTPAPQVNRPPAPAPVLKPPPPLPTDDFAPPPPLYARFARASSFDSLADASIKHNHPNNDNRRSGYGDSLRDSQYVPSRLYANESVTRFGSGVGLNSPQANGSRKDLSSNGDSPPKQSKSRQPTGEKPSSSTDRKNLISSPAPLGTTSRLVAANKPPPPLQKLNDASPLPPKLPYKLSSSSAIRVLSESRSNSDFSSERNGIVRPANVEKSDPIPPNGNPIPPRIRAPSGPGMQPPEDTRATRRDKDLPIPPQKLQPSSPDVASTPLQPSGTPRVNTDILPPSSEVAQPPKPPPRSSSRPPPSIPSQVARRTPSAATLVHPSQRLRSPSQNHLRALPSPPGSHLPDAAPSPSSTAVPFPVPQPDRKPDIPVATVKPRTPPAPVTVDVPILPASAPRVVSPIPLSPGVPCLSSSPSEISSPLPNHPNQPVPSSPSLPPSSHSTSVSAAVKAARRRSSVEFGTYDIQAARKEREHIVNGKTSPVSPDGPLPQTPPSSSRQSEVTVPPTLDYPKQQLKEKASLAVEEPKPSSRRLKIIQTRTIATVVRPTPPSNSSSVQSLDDYDPYSSENFAPVVKPKVKPTTSKLALPSPFAPLQDSLPTSEDTSPIPASTVPVEPHYPHELGETSVHQEVIIPTSGLAVTKPLEHLPSPTHIPEPSSPPNTSHDQCSSSSVPTSSDESQPVSFSPSMSHTSPSTSASSDLPAVTPEPTCQEDESITTPKAQITPVQATTSTASEQSPLHKVKQPRPLPSLPIPKAPAHQPEAEHPSELPCAPQSHPIESDIAPENHLTRPEPEPEPEPIVGQDTVPTENENTNQASSDAPLPRPRPRTLSSRSRSRPRAIIDDVPAEPEDSPPAPTFYPIIKHLLHPQLLDALLTYLSFRDTIPLLCLDASSRRQLEETKEVKEVILERYLKHSIGYTRWSAERMGKKREPLSLTLRDLNSYMRGISVPPHYYGSVAENFLSALASSSSPSLQQPSRSTIPKQLTNQVRMMASSSRAYTRTVLRLRAQAEAEQAHIPEDSAVLSERGRSPVASRNGRLSSTGPGSHPPTAAPASLNKRSASPAFSFSSSHQPNHYYRPANSRASSISEYSGGDRALMNPSVAAVSFAVGKFRSPLWKMGHAPLLRVFVPSPEGAWLSDASVLECERELKRAGVLGLLKVGDVIWDLAAGEEANTGRLVWDGNYLIDLDYSYSVTGELPRYIDSLAFPPAYWHKIIRVSGNPICHIDLSPWAREISNNLQLLQDRVQTETPQGSHHTVVRWIHRTKFKIRPNTLIPSSSGTAVGNNQKPRAIIDKAWEGTVVIEAEGTNEGLADLQHRVGDAVILFPATRAGVKTNGDVLQDLNRSANGPRMAVGSTVFRLIRAHSRPGEIWLRCVRDKERIT